MVMSACALLDGWSQPLDQSNLQKRLTYSQSDVVATGLIKQLVDNQESLLIGEQADPDGWPLPPVSVVIMYEKQLCGLEKPVRQDLMNRLKTSETLPDRFQTLLLASCAPDFTPAVLARSLKQVRGAREWPISYEAYYDLLDRHQQALVRLENLYGNLKEQMDTTIEKLTEIEVESQP
ncbi:MAG: hypothetical protein R3208_17440 [Ketobacteraceae bacterium]|nr:hypothetical protein [Ketobacteraceae bacterium]